MLIAVAAAFRDLPHFHCAAQYQLSRRLDPFLVSRSTKLAPVSF